MILNMLAKGSGGGGGGGTSEDYYMFDYTPTVTENTVTINAGSFVLSDYYMIFVRSNNTTNDPSSQTIVTGGRAHMPHQNMAGQQTDFGRITTLKAGSGTDYWNSPAISASQSGSALTVTGYGNNGKFNSGATYSFYIQNINEWAE